MNKPYFSIVTVCYNSEKTIEKTIKSILNQTFQDYEYIIIDGKSRDCTLEIVKKYQEQFGNKMKVVSERDNGLYDAMNKGIRLATGRYVSILNSDDWYNPNTLQYVHELTEKENEYYAVIGNIQRVSEDEKPIYIYDFDMDRIEKKIAFGHPSMFITKTVYEEVGEYNLEYSLAADIDFQYRLYEKDSITWNVSKEVFTNMRAGGATDNPKYRKKWVAQYSEINHRYKGGNILFHKFKCYFGIWGRSIKNAMPYGLQRLAYNCYRK